VSIVVIDMYTNI